MNLYLKLKLVAGYDAGGNGCGIFWKYKMLTFTTLSPLQELVGVFLVFFWYFLNIATFGLLLFITDCYLLKQDFKGNYFLFGFV